MKVGIGLKASEGLPVIKLQNRFKHLLCIGSTGTGKTTFFSYLIKNELENACVILDPNGSLTESILPFIPKQRLIYINKKNYISLNPLTRNYLNWSENAKELIQVINAAVKEISPKQVDITALMTRITKNALRVFSKKQLNIEYLMKFLDDKFERQKFNEDHYWKNFDKIRGEHIESARRISARLSLYYDDLDLRPFLSGNNDFEINNIVKQKKIVIVNLDGFDDEATAFIGSLITNQIKSYYQHQAKKGGEPLFFYCDEFHLFISQDFGRFLAEGRKYNISINFAGHSFANLDDFFQSTLLACHTKIVLNNDYKDANILADALQIKPSEILELKTFRAIARIGNKNHHILLYKPSHEEQNNTNHTKSKKKETPSFEKQFDFLGDSWISL